MEYITSHPPTIYRIQYVEKLQLTEQWKISTYHGEKVKEELEKRKEDIHKKIIEDYRYAMFG